MGLPSTQVRFAPINAVAEKVTDLQRELRGTIGQVEDLQARAMLETGAEVLGGLRRALVDYVESSEAAWQR